MLAPDRRRPGAASPDPRVVWFAWRGGQRPVASLGGPAGAPAALHLLASGYAAAVSLHLLASGYAAAVSLHRRAPVDHVLAVFAVPAGLIAAGLAAAPGLPYSVWALGSDLQLWPSSRPRRALLALVLRRARHRFANSRALVEQVEAIGRRPCALLLAARALPLPAPVPVDRRRRNLLFLGRLESVKGADLLPAAFERVARAVPDLDLHVVGGGSLAPALGRAAASSGGRLHLHPPAAPAEVAGYLAASDLLLLPSRSESLPAVLVEAASAGLPVVASAVGDVARLVGEHGLGAVIAPGDAAALAGAILAWAARPPRRLEAGVAGALARDASPEAAADRFLAAIASCGA